MKKQKKSHALRTFMLAAISICIGCFILIFILIFIHNMNDMLLQSEQPYDRTG